MTAIQNEQRARLEGAASLLVFAGALLGVALAATPGGGVLLGVSVVAALAMAALIYTGGLRRKLPGALHLLLGGAPAGLGLLLADGGSAPPAHVAQLVTGAILSSVVLSAFVLSAVVLTLRTGRFDPLRFGIGVGATLVGLVALFAVRAKVGLGLSAIDAPLLVASVSGIVGAGLIGMRVGRVVGASRWFALAFAASVAAVMLAGVGAEHLIGVRSSAEPIDLAAAASDLAGRREATVASMAVVAAPYLVLALAHLGTLGAGYSWAGIGGTAVVLGALTLVAVTPDRALADRSSAIDFRQVAGLELPTPDLAGRGARAHCQGTLVFFEKDGTAWFHPPEAEADLTKYQAGALEGRDIVVVADQRIGASELLSVLEWEKPKSLSLAIRPATDTSPDLGKWAAWLQQGPPCIEISVDPDEAMKMRLGEKAAQKDHAWLVLVDGDEMRYFVAPLPSYIHQGPVGPIEKAVRGPRAGTPPGLTPRDVVVTLGGSPKLSDLLAARRQIVPPDSGCDGCDWQPPRLHLSRHYDLAKRAADGLPHPKPRVIPWEGLKAPELRQLELPEEPSALLPFVPRNATIEFSEARRGESGPPSVRKIVMTRAESQFSCKVSVEAGKEKDCAPRTPPMVSIYATLWQVKLDRMERRPKPPRRWIGPRVQRHLELRWKDPAGTDQSIRIDLGTVGPRSLPTWKLLVGLMRDAIATASAD
jgi:hypothetical protein